MIAIAVAKISGATQNLIPKKALTNDDLNPQSPFAHIYTANQ